MQKFLITYNIDQATNRQDFVAEFEKVLTDIGFQKEHTNQSTYFGEYRGVQDLVRDLFNILNKPNWKWLENDIVTIYYPRVLITQPKNLPDIEKHLFKSAGNTLLNHIVFKN